MEEVPAFDYLKPMQLFELKRPVCISAPMVRYSKLLFRLLVRRHNVDLCYTQMIMADSFAASPLARQAEFSTTENDRPLVVQFAASNAKDFGDAAELVARHCDAVDLNCGCPQRWAMAEGCGAKLLSDPALVCDMVRSAQRRTGLPVSIKIRIDPDPRKTVELVRRVEKMGVAWVTVHGRTVQERHSPVHYDIINQVKASLSIPVVANGNVFTKDDANRVSLETGCDGVMAARGLLSNPALFAGYTSTPQECVQQWVDLNMAYGSDVLIFRNTLGAMLETVLANADRREMASKQSVAALLTFLSRYGIAANPLDHLQRPGQAEHQLSF